MTDIVESDARHQILLDKSTAVTVGLVSRYHLSPLLHSSLHAQHVLVSLVLDYLHSLKLDCHYINPCIALVHCIMSHYFNSCQSLSAQCTHCNPVFTETEKLGNQEFFSKPKKLVWPPTNSVLDFDESFKYFVTIP